MPRHYSQSLRCCFNIIKTQVKLVFVSLWICLVLVLTSHLWKDLLQSLDMLVRVVLIRLQVDCKSTSHLLIATLGLRRKNQPPDSLSFINTIIPTFFEILSDGLLLKIRLRVTTLQSILEVDLGARLMAIFADLTFFRLLQMHKYLLASRLSPYTPNRLLVL